MAVSGVAFLLMSYCPPSLNLNKISLPRSGLPWNGSGEFNWAPFHVVVLWGMLFFFGGGCDMWHGIAVRHVVPRATLPTTSFAFVHALYTYMWIIKLI